MHFFESGHPTKCLEWVACNSFLHVNGLDHIDNISLLLMIHGIVFL